MTAATHTSTATPTSPVSLAASLKAGLTGGLLGAVGCYLVYGVGLLAGVEFVGAFMGPDAPASALPVPMILVANLVPGLVASFAFLGFTRALGAPRTPWLITAAVLAAASCVPPLTLAGASTGTRVALAVMHPVAALFIAGSLARLAPRR